MKVYILYCFMICSLFVSCIKEYKLTAKICNNVLYLEVYNINPAGVDADYLTDSTNFRMYVGSYDNEHDYFTYECSNDSIYILKIQTGNTNCHWVTLSNGKQTVQCDIDTIERKTVSLSQLKKLHKFE